MSKTSKAIIRTFTEALASPTSLRGRFGRGLAFSVVAAVFNSGSTFLVNIAVANLLGRDTFGEFAIVQNTLLTMATVASLATGITATKYVSEFRSVDPAKTARILGLCSTLSLVMGISFTLALLAGASSLANVVLRAPQLSSGMKLAAPVVFFSVHNFYQTGALAGLEGYSGIAKAGVIAGIAYCLLCVAGSLVWGREGALAGLSVSAGVQWLALGFFLRRERLRQRIGVDYRGMWEEREMVIKFAVPAALSGFSSMPALWLSSAFLVRQTDGYSQMALYAAATNLRVLVLLLPQLLNNVGMSLLNNVKGLGNIAQYRKVFWSNLGLTVSVTVAGAVAMALFGPYALAIFGRRFGGGYPVLLVLMASTVIETLMQASYQVILSHGRMWLSFGAVVFPRDVMIVLLAFLLTPLSGAVGLAVAYTLGAGLALLSTALVAFFLSRTAANYAKSLHSPLLID